MPIKRVSAKEAVPLQGIGYKFVDVRTPKEYGTLHPEGAINVPFMVVDGFDMKPNSNFVPIIEKLYPDKAQKLLLVGKVGKRSLAAAEALDAAGYTELCDMRPGFHGLVDDRGRFLEDGWKGLGLACEPKTEGGSYSEIRKRLGFASVSKSGARPSRPSTPPPGGIKRVSAKEAVPLGKIGYIFIDVRAPGEYGKGHPVKAINIPWALVDGFNMKDNPNFLPLVKKLFPKTDAKLLIIGKIGKRSMVAAKALKAAGYTALVEVRPGYLGLVDDRGRYTEDGWKELGLAIENKTEGGSYAELLARAGLTT
jgi:rhodanese-related sulfurtransferase